MSTTNHGAPLSAVAATREPTAHAHRCMRCNHEFTCQMPNLCAAKHDVMPVIVTLRDGQPFMRDHCRQNEAGEWEPTADFPVPPAPPVAEWCPNHMTTPEGAVTNVRCALMAGHAEPCEPLHTHHFDRALPAIDGYRYAACECGATEMKPEKAEPSRSPQGEPPARATSTEGARTTDSDLFGEVVARVDGLTIHSFADSPNLHVRHARDGFCVTPDAWRAMGVALTLLPAPTPSAATETPRDYTPKGFRKVDAAEVWVSDSQIVLLGTPSDVEDENHADYHNCDDMGCGSLGWHVVARYYLHPRIG